MPNALVVDKVNKLIDDISDLYENARQAQVVFAWETGKLIVVVEQDGEVRAEYGTGLLQRISDALTKRFGQGAGFSVSNLGRMRQFFLQNQKSAVPRELDWGHHVELLAVKDEKVRLRLEKRVVSQGLNCNQLRELVKSEVKTADVVPSNLPPLKRPTDLKLNTYAKAGLNVKVGADAVLLDYGFFVNGTVVKEALAAVTVTDKPSYTYAATVERVVDGDTLWVLIDVGFGIIVREKLRLRGVNTPELGTPEGEKAKRFVNKILPAGASFVLKSTKSKVDKYGRFLADVFYLESDSAPEEIVTGGVYLNQQLMDDGYAVRMD